MRILGIDPGTATSGYGVIDVNKEIIDVVGWGLIETDKTGTTANRLEAIYKATGAIIKKFSPDIFVIEKIFFATNAKTAIAVGQAQGVMMLTASKAKLKVAEYAPGTIKKMVTGDGRAKKKDIQKSVRKILGNKVRSKSKKKTHFDNAADALAVALCHYYKLGGLPHGALPRRQGGLAKGGLPHGALAKGGENNG
ncbi:MAG: crossover junction endodeoxyribonuclease RuvC [bacterium]|nr:crossover junction endodeoxyribonuclease RuvC [bacterium]